MGFVATREKKAQGSLDYISTYSWSILAIAVVLIILVKLGIFNSSLTGSSCVGAVGFLCSNPIMNSSGYLAATIGSAAQPIKIIAVGCSNSTAPPSSFSQLSSPLYLQPQQTVTQLFHCPIPANS
ncbi:MAG: hypothetical protein ACP5LH_03735, partial [Candidatus Micrarchaeia archaeon]